MLWKYLYLLFSRLWSLPTPVSLSPACCITMDTPRMGHTEDMLTLLSQVEKTMISFSQTGIQKIRTIDVRSEKTPDNKLSSESDHFHTMSCLSIIFSTPEFNTARWDTNVSGLLWPGPKYENQSRFANFTCYFKVRIAVCPKTNQ